MTVGGQITAVTNVSKQASTSIRRDGLMLSSSEIIHNTADRFMTISTYLVLLKVVTV